MNGCQSPNSKLYLGKNIRRGGLISTGKNITRAGLISTGKMARGGLISTGNIARGGLISTGKNMARGGLISTGKICTYIHIHTFLNIHPCIYAHMHTFMNFRPQTSRYAYAALRHGVCGAGVTRLRDQLEVMNANTQEVTDRVAQHEQYQDLLFGG